MPRTRTGVSARKGSFGGTAARKSRSSSNGHFRGRGSPRGKVVRIRIGVSARKGAFGGKNRAGESFEFEPEFQRGKLVAARKSRSSSNRNFRGERVVRWKEPRGGVVRVRTGISGEEGQVRGKVVRVRTGISEEEGQVREKSFEFEPEFPRGRVGVAQANHANSKGFGGALGASLRGQAWLLGGECAGFFWPCAVLHR